MSLFASPFRRASILLGFMPVIKPAPNLPHTLLSASLAARLFATVARLKRLATDKTRLLAHHRDKSTLFARGSLMAGSAKGFKVRRRMRLVLAKRNLVVYVKRLPVLLRRFPASLTHLIAFADSSGGVPPARPIAPRPTATPRRRVFAGTRPSHVLEVNEHLPRLRALEPKRRRHNGFAATTTTGNLNAIAKTGVPRICSRLAALRPVTGSFACSRWTGNKVFTTDIANLVNRSFLCGHNATSSIGVLSSQLYHIERQAAAFDGGTLGNPDTSQEAA
jgi:hypothetical protein